MWYSGNYTELEITKKQASQGSHSGSCDMDIAELRQAPNIHRQLNKLSVESVKNELDEFGCWSEEELSNHDENLNRLLWIACGDITEVMV